MNSTLSINPSFSTPLLPPPNSLRTSATRILRPPHILFSHKTLTKNLSTITSAASSHHTPPNPSNPIIYPLKAAAACAIIFAATAFGKFPHLPARAETTTAPETLIEEVVDKEKEENSLNTPLTQLEKLLKEKLVSGDYEEGLSILRKLSSAQPDNFGLKFLIAKVLNKTGKTKEARDAFESVLAQNPLSFKTLFENALLMEWSGEREAVMRRLEQALKVAEDENKMKEARDVKLIMAYMQFLRKNMDEALMIYNELAKEDPSDSSPYLFKGVIYGLLDKHDEAREQFAKHIELSPKFKEEGHLSSPSSWMKIEMIYSLLRKTEQFPKYREQFAKYREQFAKYFGISMESKPEAIDALTKLLKEKLVSGDYEEGLSILRKLSSAQPANFGLKFLIAKVLNKTGKTKEARDAFELVLAQNPLSFKALFENALLMEWSGEREAVMRRLEQALKVAEDENKMKEARDVKLIMAYMQFLRKNMDEALMIYDELAKEDPSDSSPYFFKGVIYGLLDKDDEAREQFAKHIELSPKFKVEGYLSSPLSWMKNGMLSSLLHKTDGARKQFPKYREQVAKDFGISMECYTYDIHCKPVSR